MTLSRLSKRSVRKCQNYLQKYFFFFSASTYFATLVHILVVCFSFVIIGARHCNVARSFEAFYQMLFSPLVTPKQEIINIAHLRLRRKYLELLHLIYTEQRAFISVLLYLSHCFKIAQNVAFEFLLMLAVCINFCLIKIDLLVTLFKPFLQVFKNSSKRTLFWHFYELFSSIIVSIARFARNVE